VVDAREVVIHVRGDDLAPVADGKPNLKYSLPNSTGGLLQQLFELEIRNSARLLASFKNNCSSVSRPKS